MREAGRVVALVLERMRELVAPGVTTGELDAAAEEIIRSRDGTPAFKGYEVPGKPPFPGTICASVNDEVVHGIPGDRALREGDIVSIDVGAKRNGYFGDAAVTLPVGRVSAEAAKLMQVCSQALQLAIEQVKPGNHLCETGKAVQHHVEKNQFSVVRDFTGHGIGTQMHQAPQVPNYETKGTPDVKMQPGLVLAIEPMINAGGYKVETDDNFWTVRTTDGRLSAHFEHTVAVTPGGNEIFTLR